MACILCNQQNDDYVWIKCVGQCNGVYHLDCLKIKYANQSHNIFYDTNLANYLTSIPTLNWKCDECATANVNTIDWKAVLAAIVNCTTTIAEFMPMIVQLAASSPSSIASSDNALTEKYV